mmetsp:Transcript_13993/g.34601  ORF Transcript_13993/g.34601 Transcript_13993/m.34601 type:complete len:1176 (-) Transcript_13993:254-3781(-)|eukprot:CAMPEP_0178993364 /NCGR_PEP_ID=MMETSP0795-20121207/6663_1 /TAXON_ID=88552 /ORGANISM="Amoebophrya sp., Strain Ameob2" /LENGTH=1175 /DNA_ID=CAMNT_0020685417 /DNA_START=313 /DNA_END=3840 /DNA_ORIENTATION=+
MNRGLIPRVATSGDAIAASPTSSGYPTLLQPISAQQGQGSFQKGGSSSSSSSSTSSSKPRVLDVQLLPGSSRQPSSSPERFEVICEEAHNEAPTFSSEDEMPSACADDNCGCSFTSVSTSVNKQKRIDVFKLLPNQFQNKKRQVRLSDTSFFNESARMIRGRKKGDNKFAPAVITPKSPKERIGARAILAIAKLELDPASGRAVPKTLLTDEEESVFLGTSSGVWGARSGMTSRAGTAGQHGGTSTAVDVDQDGRTRLAPIPGGGEIVPYTDIRRNKVIHFVDDGIPPPSMMDDVLEACKEKAQAKKAGDVKKIASDDELSSDGDDGNQLAPSSMKKKNKKEAENKGPSLAASRASSRNEASSETARRPGSSPTGAALIKKLKQTNLRSSADAGAAAALGPGAASLQTTMSTTFSPNRSMMTTFNATNARSSSAAPPSGPPTLQGGALENETFDDFDAEVADYDSDYYDETQDGASSLDAYSPHERVKFLQSSTDEELMEKGIYRFRKVTAVSDRATELRSQAQVENDEKNREQKGRQQLLATIREEEHGRSVFDTYMDDTDASSEDDERKKPKVSKFEARATGEKQKIRIQEMEKRTAAGVRSGPYQLPLDSSPLSRFGNLATPGDYLVLEDVPGIGKWWFTPTTDDFVTPSTLITNAALFPLNDPQFQRPPPGTRIEDPVEENEFEMGHDGYEEVILIDVPEPEEMNLVVPRAVRDPNNFPEEVSGMHSPRRQIQHARMVEDRRRLEFSLKQSIVMRKGQVDAISKLFAKDDQKATRACGPFCYPRYTEYRPNNKQGLPVIEMMPVFEDRRNRFYHVRRVVRPARINMIRSTQQKEIDRVLLEQRKAADLEKKKSLFGKKNLLKNVLKKEGGLMDQIRSSILVVDHKEVHHKPPYHLLYSLKKHAESWKRFGLDWCYGILNDLVSDKALGNFLWDVNWQASDQSARVFKMTVGGEAKRLAENKELLLNMFTTVPEGVIREVIKKKREMLGKETNVENELLQADVERLRQDMLARQGVDPRKATESKIMENHRHHETELRDMPLRHTNKFICAVRDISQAFEIRDAYKPWVAKRNADLSRLYCVGCKRIILKLGERQLFFYCQKCEERHEKPYCLCTNCNDAFRMSLMAYKLLEDTVEAEKERMAQDLLATAAENDEENDPDAKMKKATAALFG